MQYHHAEFPMVYQTSSQLAEVLERYEKKLNVLKQRKEDATLREIADVLQIRDEIEVLAKNGNADLIDDIERLVENDEALQIIKAKYIREKDLEKCRQSLHSSSDGWWWQPPGSRNTLLWTSLTALCAVGIFSYTGAIIKVLSVFGFSFGSIFGTLGSGALGLFVGQSGLTEDGKRRIKRSLSALGVDSKNHDRTIFLISLSLFAVVAAYSQLLLPYQARQKLNLANQEFENGNFLVAEATYRDALNFPSLENNPLISFRLGKIYENRRDWEQSESYYRAGVAHGYIDAYIGLIRIKLLQELDSAGWGNLSSSTVREIEGLISQAEEVITQENAGSLEEEFEYQVVLYQLPIYRELKLNEGLLYWASIDVNSENSALSLSEQQIQSRQFSDARNSFAQILINQFPPDQQPAEFVLSDASGYSVDPDIISNMVDANYGTPGCFLAMTGLMEWQMMSRADTNMAINSYKTCFLGENQLGEYGAFWEFAHNTPPLATSVSSYVEYAATYF